MDEELRRYLDDIKASQRESTGEVKGLVNGLSQSLNAHVEQSAGRWAEVNQRAESSHRRMDEHIENHRSWQSSGWSTWVAIATSLLAIVVAIAVAVLQKG